MTIVPVELLAATIDPDLAVWLRFLGRLHAATVHFPIALILTAALFEFLCVFRRGHPISKMAVTCLTLGALSAALAGWFGWLNADLEPHGSAVAQTLELHRWTGITAGGLAFVALLFGAVSGLAKAAAWPGTTYRLTLFLAVLALAFGGYLGGEIVHGEDYLLSVFRAAPSDAGTPGPSEASPPVLATDVAALDHVDFESHVRPLLVARCSECHGPQRQKAGLVLDPIAEAFNRDRDEWVIVPGEPEQSLLVERIRLEADHPDRMPKRGDPLSTDEITLIERWIAQGAEHATAAAPGRMPDADTVARAVTAKEASYLPAPGPRLQAHRRYTDAW
ncbi:MAG: c-type cytochrome domain-containing protein [Planctomycetota bacterium]